MNELERLTAIDEIRQVKSQYFRGVDTCDGDLVRSILAPDCHKFEIQRRGDLVDDRSSVLSARCELLPDD